MTKENVPFDLWQRLDLRVAEILKVEDIPEAHKLYKLLVDLGTETRTLVAGLRPYYTKDELEGKKCIVFTNLEPKQIKGVTSHGMILAAINDDTSITKLINPEGVIDIGCKIM